MPWNWNAKYDQSVEIGGARGTEGDALSTRTWPNYEASYLAKRLGSNDPKAAQQNRYAAGKTIDDEAARAVYLDRVTANYKTEADECLKREFVEWLQGTHEANHIKTPYPNLPGQMKRRAVFRTDMHSPGDQINDWNATRWGDKQLVHLPGVRDFLRDMKTNANQSELQMNVLAEFGPQNLDQAWAYFKHWVKGRPVAPEECIETFKTDKFTRSGPTWMADDDDRTPAQTAQALNAAAAAATTAQQAASAASMTARAAVAGRASYAPAAVAAAAQATNNVTSANAAVEDAVMQDAQAVGQAQQASGPASVPVVHTAADAVTAAMRDNFDRFAGRAQERDGPKDAMEAADARIAAAKASSKGARRAVVSSNRDVAAGAARVSWDPSDEFEAAAVRMGLTPVGRQSPSSGISGNEEGDKSPKSRRSNVNNYARIDPRSLRAGLDNDLFNQGEEPMAAIAQEERARAASRAKAMEVEDVAPSRDQSNR